MNAKKFEQAFDDDINITASLDLSKARRVQQDQVTTNTQSRDATLKVLVAVKSPSNQSRKPSRPRRRGRAR